MDESVLDDPVRASLEGTHAHLARRLGSAATYAEGGPTFVALPRDPGANDWADLGRLLGPGEVADLFSADVVAPEHWEPVFAAPALQLLAPHALPEPAPDLDVVELGPADLRAMLTLARLTRPGPLWRRSPELGTFLGVRHEGRLVAMAGERLRPPGWSEISSVCVHPDARGRGLAVALVEALVARTAARGDRSFLHVVADNTAALGLYERLGFTVRREVRFHGYRVPE